MTFMRQRRRLYAARPAQALRRPESDAPGSRCVTPDERFAAGVTGYSGATGLLPPRFPLTWRDKS